MDNKRLVSQHYEITTMIGIGEKIRSGYYEKENKRIPWGASVWVRWVYSGSPYTEIDGEPFTYHDWASNYHDFVVSIMETRGYEHKSPLIRSYKKISIMKFIEWHYHPPEINQDYLMKDLVGLFEKWIKQDKRKTIPEEVNKERFVTWANSLKPYRVPDNWKPGDPPVPKELRKPFKFKMKGDS